jgi:hypothetical protein
MKGIVYGSIILGSVTFANLSRADLKFCNVRSDAVYVAFVASVNRISPLPCQASESNPELFSWYYLPPNGGCTTLISGTIFSPANGPGSPIDWFAEGANGEYWAGADAQYCPMNSEASFFDPQPICNAQYVNFQRLASGNDTDYTVTLGN